MLSGTVQKTSLWSERPITLGMMPANNGVLTGESTMSMADPLMCVAPGGVRECNPAAVMRGWI